MKIALLTIDNRWLYREFGKEFPWFGMAPEALISGLAAMPGMELHVVSCTRYPLNSPEKLAPNVYFHSLHVPKFGWMQTGYLGCIRAVRRRLQLLQPDLVHGHGTEYEAAICAAHSGFPNVITLLGVMSEMARVLKARPGSFYWFAALLENYSLRRTAGVVANSRFTEEKVRLRTPRTWLVPNAVREAFFESPRTHSLPPSQGQRGTHYPPILLNVGNVCAYKRQNELLDVAAQLHADGFRFKLEFLGRASPENPYAARFLARVKDKPYVEYHGFQSLSEVIARYDQAAALIHVSKIESFGLVVAEALSRNLKFIGFDSGGVADIVAGVEDAEAFPENDWANIQSALGRWLRTGAARPNSAAQTMRLRYHPTAIARKHLEIYREILDRTR